MRIPINLALLCWIGGFFLPQIYRTRRGGVTAPEGGAIAPEGGSLPHPKGVGSAKIIAKFSAKNFQ